MWALKLSLFLLTNDVNLGGKYIYELFSGAVEDDFLD
jgi:hypothetical protein